MDAFLSYIQDKFSIFAKISFQYKETDIITIFYKLLLSKPMFWK